jgi:hypothetical protein
VRDRTSEHEELSVAQRRQSPFPPLTDTNLWLAAGLFVSSAVSLSPLLNSLGADEKIPPLILAITAGIYFMVRLITHRRIAQRKSLPEHTGAFSPFGRWDQKKIWSRESETKVLGKLIIEAESAHIVVTGVSGAGKTVLVHKLVKEYLEKYDSKGGIQFKVLVFDSYGNFAGDILSNLPIVGDSALAKRLR